MKIRPNPNFKLRLDPNRPIEIFSSSEDESDGDSDENEDDDVIEISSDETIGSTDDEMSVDQSEPGEMSVDQSERDDLPLDQLVGSRSSSTDAEVSGDDIDLNNVRWASSDDEESDDPALVLRGPNPMIPGEL